MAISLSPRATVASTLPPVSNRHHQGVRPPLERDIFEHGFTQSPAHESTGLDPAEAEAPEACRRLPEQRERDPHLACDKHDGIGKLERSLPHDYEGTPCDEYHRSALELKAQSPELGLPRVLCSEEHTERAYWDVLGPIDEPCVNDLLTKSGAEDRHLRDT
jgi:hypothetical protein